MKGTVPGGTPQIAVHLVDPYLLKKFIPNFDEASIDLTPLYRSQNWAAVEAKGLAADGASAAIAVVQTNVCGNAALSTNTLATGTTLHPYSAGFLTTKPADGTQSVPIAASAFSKDILGSFYAAALLQAPVGAPPPAFAQIKVTARQQGSQPAQAQAELVPPPVLLVHGLWDDRDGLGGSDGAGTINGLARYLKTRSPWVKYSKSFNLEFVQVICYSKFIGFNAPDDKLLTDPKYNHESCEQTSRDAITSRIYGLLGSLDNAHIAGSRVDLVAHSMGGLAARNYASQSWYRSLRNRRLGQFHEIITLDTPELGSEMAPFLISHRSCTRKVPFGTSPPYLVWRSLCGKSPLTTVRQCLAKDRPLAAPGYPLSEGAVFSLYPPNTDAKDYPPDTSPVDNAISKLPPANIKDADWHAIGSVALNNSALKFGLNQLIAAVYPQTTPTCDAPEQPAKTIDEILGHPKNDAIVTLSSQLAGVQPNSKYEFTGLSHTGAGTLKTILQNIGFGQKFSDANVVNWPNVNCLAACWLSKSGSSACLAGFPGNCPKVIASPTTDGNKDSAPMPRATAGHPYAADRMTLRAPPRLELGKPFDLVVNTGSGGLPEFHAVQVSETGTQREVPVAISHVTGQTVYLRLTPALYGPAQFQVTAAFADGGVDTKEIMANVSLPAEPPLTFHSDELAFAGIPLDIAANPALRLQPWATWLNIPGRVYLDTQAVSYSIAPSGGPPAIRPDPNGIVYGLREGTATIIGRLTARPSTFPSRVRVNVVAEKP